RYKDLPEIMEYVSDQIKEWKKIGVTYVKTAIALNDAQRRQIEQRILETSQYEQLEMHYEVDPQIIGGMVIRIGDRVVDSTVKRKLNDLTKQLLQIQLG
ncbi:MAG: ATP synthase F1 subunit delta, partial [Lachnospiraceae bacterium]|nr:ATP synthase F1 subunit delta [Lachnospiraceae bacterium]